MVGAAGLGLQLLLILQLLLPLPAVPLKELTSDRRLLSPGLRSRPGGGSLGAAVRLTRAAVGHSSRGHGARRVGCHGRGRHRASRACSAPAPAGRAMRDQRSRAVSVGARELAHGFTLARGPRSREARGGWPAPTPVSLADCARGQRAEGVSPRKLAAANPRKRAARRHPRAEPRRRTWRARTSRDCAAARHRPARCGPEGHGRAGLLRRIGRRELRHFSLSAVVHIVIPARQGLALTVARYDRAPAVPVLLQRRRDGSWGRWHAACCRQRTRMARQHTKGSTRLVTKGGRVYGKSVRSRDAKASTRCHISWAVCSMLLLPRKPCAHEWFRRSRLVRRRRSGRRQDDVKWSRPAGQQRLRWRPHRCNLGWPLLLQSSCEGTRCGCRARAGTTCGLNCERAPDYIRAANGALVRLAESHHFVNREQLLLGFLFLRSACPRWWSCAFMEPRGVYLYIRTRRNKHTYTRPSQRI